ncbi:protein kinase, putative [Leishmania tarentolae]|uniref:Protein kinase, putative n=1 Tax=Leishmania tarentolae TaxID=5689 RepID=A0A640KK90_LEITA|nr:protein kinase, putative [Leishmania tarentolae]
MSLDADYEVERYPLVTGRRVKVCRCTHRSTGAKRAVKVYHTAAMDSRRTAMTVEEGTLAKSLPVAPQLVRVFDVYVEADRLSIVMEYIERGSLYQLITTRGALAETEARDVTRDIFTGLALLHGNNIMHRDIKPENVFLRTTTSSSTSPTGAAATKTASAATTMAAIGDFGFATRRIPHDEFVGSPQYSAPELALVALQQHCRRSGAALPVSAQPLYNEKCDVWSAGVVVFVMLTGLLPFDGATPEDVFTAVIRNAVPFDKVPPGRMSPSAKAFIQALLTPNPSRRPSAREALRHVWLTG